MSELLTGLGASFAATWILSAGFGFLSLSDSFWISSFFLNTTARVASLCFMVNVICTCSIEVTERIILRRLLQSCRAYHFVSISRNSSLEMEKWLAFPSCIFKITTHAFRFGRLIRIVDNKGALWKEGTGKVKVKGILVSKIVVKKAGNKGMIGYDTIHIWVNMNIKLGSAMSKWRKKVTFSE